MNAKLKTVKQDEESVRFEFGENWSAFLNLLDGSRIKNAEKSLKEMLGTDSLAGKSFLDIGCGSGLFSLAARNLGANVISFDFDDISVKCTVYLKEEFYLNDDNWQVKKASVLDEAFMQTLPQADYVYSWGVLHHTGNMLVAIENACKKVKPGGFFYLALYRKTILDGFWKWFKKMYSCSGKRTQSFYQKLWSFKTRLAFFVKGKNFKKMLLKYKEERGMDFYKDAHDWLGGYPYETITPADCRNLFEQSGFVLIKQKVHTEGISWSISGGCDEYLFKKTNP